jgi:hypothetical protein
LASLAFQGSDASLDIARLYRFDEAGDDGIQVRPLAGRDRAGSDGCSDSSDRSRGV